MLLKKMSFFTLFNRNLLKLETFQNSFKNSFNNIKRFYFLCSNRNVDSRIFEEKIENSNVIQKRNKFKRVGDRPPGETLNILDKTFQTDDWTNVPDKIIDLIGKELYDTPKNPLYLISQTIKEHFRDHKCYKFPNPVVDLWSNFDSILVPKDHISRQRTDTFYVNSGHVLRAHTSAHQFECFKRCSGDNNKFMIIGDVYRRDEVNRTHHAAFHQCEIVQLYTQKDLSLTPLFSLSQSRNDTCQAGLNSEALYNIEKELKNKTESYIRRLLGPDLELRWVDAYFPFTHPSWELEIRSKDDEWLEILGCGIIEQKILNSAQQTDKIGWALGLGLERLAMLYYSIPDIRLFWSRDSGFLVQYESLKPFERTTYKSVSTYPQKIFDISFWLPENEERRECWSENDVHAIILDCGGDLVEQVHLIEKWIRPKDGRISNMFRIVYRSPERALTTAEVNNIHKNVENALINQLKVEIR